MHAQTMLFVGIIVLTGTAGEIASTHAMKRVGEVHVFHPSSLFRVFSNALRIGWMWVGIAMMAAAFFSLLALLSWADVSFVVPATALSYVAGAVGARFLLHERVTPARWTGVLLVCIGVALLSLS